MSLSDYTIIEQVGEGAFSSVVTAIHKGTDKMVAIKTVSKEQMKSTGELKLIYSEIKILKKIHHPFINQFFDYFEDNELIYIVMEYSSGGTLLDLVNRSNGLKERDASILIAQVLSAMTYLHDEVHICHRDLKVENILLDSNSHPHIIDFGLSKSLDDSTGVMQTRCGSPAYTAPEMIKGDQYTMKADTWSLGIIIYAVVACRLPFDSDNVKQLFTSILYNDIYYPNKFSPLLLSLLRMMLKKDPFERATLEQVMKHPWLRTWGNIMKIRQSDIVVPESIIYTTLKNRGYNIHKCKENLNKKISSPETVAYKIIKRYLENIEVDTYVKKIIHSLAPASPPEGDRQLPSLFPMGARSTKPPIFKTIDKDKVKQYTRRGSATRITMKKIKI